MNKQELINAIAENKNLTKKDTAAFLDAFVSVVSDKLAAGEPVQLMGFGTFDVKKRDARQGRNPRTGETVTIEAKKVPVFKAGKALKDKVK